MRLRRLAAALFIAAMVLVEVPSAAAQAAPETYRHPDGLFALQVPQGAAAQPGEGPVAVRLTSIHGWTVTVQSGKANPSLDLNGMVARLEDRYLGANRPWTAKLDQRPGNLGGMPGVDLTYNGERARWQVLIARGRLTDFVVFVSAQPDSLSERGEELRGLLASFRVRDEELPERPVADQRLAPANPTSPAGAAPSAPAVVSSSPAPAAESAAPPPAAVTATAAAKPAPAETSGVPEDVGLAQRFDDASFGYTLSYPADWVFEREGAYAVIFSGRPGTQAYFAAVSVENVSPAGAGDPSAAAGAAFDERRRQIEAAGGDLSWQWERAFEYDRGGTRLLGREFLVTYRWQDQRFSKWVVVLPNPIYPVAHLFAYTAPEAAFSGYRPVAEAMLRSWMIHGTEKDLTNR